MFQSQHPSEIDNSKNYCFKLSAESGRQQCISSHSVHLFKVFFASTRATDIVFYKWSRFCSTIPWQIRWPQKYRILLTIVCSSHEVILFVTSQTFPQEAVIELWCHKLKTIDWTLIAVTLQKSVELLLASSRPESDFRSWCSLKKIFILCVPSHQDWGKGETENRGYINSIALQSFPWTASWSSYLHFSTTLMFYLIKNNPLSVNRHGEGIVYKLY